jgi:hypothetical protein
LNDDGAFRWYCFTAFGLDLGLGSNHNYFWYESPIGTRMWLIPWDLDLSFAGAARTRIDRDWRDASDCSCHYAEGLMESASPQRAPACDGLTGTLARWLSDYDETVDELLRGPLAAERVDARLLRWVELLSPLVEQSAGRRGAPSVSQWHDAVAQLRVTIDHIRATRGTWPEL